MKNYLKRYLKSQEFCEKNGITKIAISSDRKVTEYKVRHDETIKSLSCATTNLSFMFKEKEYEVPIKIKKNINKHLKEVMKLLKKFIKEQKENK